MKRTGLNRIGKSKISQLQKKCDKRLQEEGKIRYNKCEVCGNPISCLHHFFPKSISAVLRYDWDNLIPICNGCHMRHHSAGDPRIHATIIKKRGQDWYDKLLKRKNETIKVNIEYYENILNTLEMNKYSLIGHTVGTILALIVISIMIWIAK